MKTKEEIQKLSYAYSDKVNMSKDMTSLSIADAVTYGYNQCQEDMADEMVKLKNAVQLSVDLLCEADEEIALLKEQLLGFQNP